MKSTMLSLPPQLVFPACTLSQGQPQKGFFLFLVALPKYPREILSMKSSLRYLGAVREDSRYSSPNSAYLNSLSCEKQIGLFLFVNTSPKEPR